MHETFQYRLYPTKDQVQILTYCLATCRYLYNEMLADRKNAYDRCGIGLTYNQQAEQLKYLNLGIHSQVAQDVLRRLDKAFQNFFRRVKNGDKKAGYPRFQGRNRYDSFTYPQSGFKILEDGRLKLSKIGAIRIFRHREIEGTPFRLGTAYFAVPEEHRSMRSIGTIQDKEQAHRFALYLHAQGIENQVEALPPEGYEVWVLSEDRLVEARELLGRFLEDPDDPEYARASAAARALLEEAARRTAHARNREIDIRTQWRLQILGAIPLLTFMLILASVAVFLAMKTGAEEKVRDLLSITRFETVGAYIRWRPGLPEILHGQVWRLFTPMLIHFNILHILFNLLWLKDLGTLVERRYGRLRFVLLVGALGAFSNLGQYMVTGPFFGGMSGVVFGLLGFVWLRGRFDPSAGFHLPRIIVFMMGAWFFLCLFGFIPHIANTAHAVGLGIGMAWGYLSSGHLKRLGSKRF